MIFRHSFGSGGIRPDGYKSLTCHKKIENADVPNIAYIPINQHVGTPANIIVKKGQKIEEGQLIAEADGPISANVHSSIPGEVLSIEEHYIYSGIKSLLVKIKLMGEFKKSGKNIQLIDWRSKTKEDLLKIIKNYGIVGLGGISFPTYAKLTLLKNKKIETLIINGAECEPFLTADHRLMIDRSEDLFEGITILQTILGDPKVFIGIETNKIDAIRRLKILCSNKYNNIKIIPLKSKYPSGDERQIIKAITGKFIPVDLIPIDMDILIFNVSTVIAIKEAIVNDKPLIERVITVSGSGIQEPKNLKVKIGTLIRELIEECGGLKPGVKKIVIGGPMMGFAQMNLDIPVTKNCSGILAFTDEEYDDYNANSVCINCGRCIMACPYGLMPTLLNRYIKYKRYQDIIKSGLMYCKECGCCSWVCPARIPLVQNFRMGKDITKKLKNNSGNLSTKL